MRLFKKGDKIVWYDQSHCNLKGVVTKDQLPLDYFIQTKWFCPNEQPMWADYHPKLIQLAKTIIKNYVWVVEVYKDDMWKPLIALTTRDRARYFSSAESHKTRIKKYYS